LSGNLRISRDERKAMAESSFEQQDDVLITPQADASPEVSETPASADNPIPYSFAKKHNVLVRLLDDSYELLTTVAAAKRLN